MDDFSQNIKKKAFHPLEEYPEFKWLASKYAVIAEELKKNSFWMDWGSDDYDPTGHCEFLKGNWTVCPVYFGRYDPHSIPIPGQEHINVDALVKSLPEKFPKTTKILKAIDRVNFAAFSRLHPKSHLAPHTHKNPDAYIFHLGIIIPTGNTCGLKVEGETHVWTKPGDAVIFNDTLTHSAWNDSDEERIILYVDFTHRTISVDPQEPFVGVDIE